MDSRDSSLANRAGQRVVLLVVLLVIGNLLFACDRKDDAAPPRSNEPMTAVAASSQRAIAPGVPEGMVLLPGGEFLMGSDHGMPGEAPRHSVKLRPFYIDRYAVTVEQFARFVEATRYKTDNERFGFGAVFSCAHGPWVKPERV